MYVSATIPTAAQKERRAVMSQVIIDKPSPERVLCWAITLSWHLSPALMKRFLSVSFLRWSGLGTLNLVVGAFNWKGAEDDKSTYQSE